MLPSIQLPGTGIVADNGGTSDPCRRDLTNQLPRSQKTRGKESSSKITGRKTGRLRTIFK